MTLLHRESQAIAPPRHTTDKRAKKVCAALLVAASLGIAACSDQIDYRGYLPRGTDVQKIHTGLSKTEVVAILGSPSTTATTNTNGDTFYYISSVVKTVAIFEPQVIDREVFAIHFDLDKNVQRLAHYGIEDGKIVDFISRQTPTRGTELTLLRSLFGRLGEFGSAPDDEVLLPDDF